MVSATRSEKKLLISVVLIGLLVRGATSLASLDHYSPDPDAYRAIAETLANTGVYGLLDPAGEGRPTAFRPPLYPYLLSWITTGGRLSNVAVAALHTLLGTLTILCTFLASRRLLGDTFHPAIHAIAATLVAIDPILLQQSIQVMTETLATALVSIILWWWSKRCESLTPRGAAVLGILLSLAFLCRPTFLVWAAMLSFALPWVNGWRRVSQRTEAQRNEPQRSGRQRLANSLILGGLVLLTVALWTFRNQRSLGHPVWATTHGGYTLLLANNPSFYEYLEEGEFGVAWDPEPFFLAYSHRYQGDPNSEAFWHRDYQKRATISKRVSEHEDDRVAYDAARATIDRQGATFVWSCVVRLGRLWTPIPHHTPGRSWWGIAAIAAYYTLLYLATLVGLWRIGRRVFGARWWPVWTLAITLSLVHAVYWSNLRMRAPMIPAMAIIAAAGCQRKPQG